MDILIRRHTYKYECEKVCRIFFPLEKFAFPAEGEPWDGNRVVETRVDPDDGCLTFSCAARIEGKQAEASLTVPAAEVPDDAAGEKQLARAMVRVLSEITGVTPPWGILTGVRPSKLMRAYRETLGEAGAARKFRDFLGVSAEKTALALEIDRNQREIADGVTPRDCSVYVSIPFCPTRCAYCSFVSHSVAQAGKLIPDYLRRLDEEIRLTARAARQAGVLPRTVYVGGGTPTSLSAAELAGVLRALNEAFDARHTAEFTVEAGRPDTITREKLLAMREAGVGRISVNPQTFSDAVLRAVGRRHTAADTVETYRLARELGFDNINMDLIAGLPTDTLDGFCASLRQAVDLSPENITVHTLALKRAADLAGGGGAAAETTAAMVAFSREYLSSHGYTPYYMYRQSKSAGNLENVGWTKPGRACLYNVYMMEELHTVLACGGGAVSKLIVPGDRNIARIYNFKYPYEYISRFDELAARKAEITAFYQRNGLTGSPASESAE